MHALPSNAARQNADTRRQLVTGAGDHRRENAGPHDRENMDHSSSVVNGARAPLGTPMQA